MNEPIISVSGLRGIVGESLTPIHLVRYVSAFASGIAKGPVVVTRDGRSTGEMIANLVCGTLQATGHTVINAGVVATPTTGVLVRSLNAVAGIQISASHNPPEYNGLKLFDSTGRVLPAAAGERVLACYHDGQPSWVGYQSLGSAERCADPTSAHLSLVLSTVDIDKIRRRKFKVLLDSNHGAGSLLGKQLLDKLGCQVVAIGDEPDGQFAHPPEPTADNLKSICDIAKKSNVDIVFCQDPDADRLAVLDEHGRYIGEEYTLALCLDHVLQNRSGVIVTNCATSRMSQDIAERHGAKFIRSAVGEANVVDAMLANDAVFGGEGNGGPIDPRVGFVRDSFVGMALILDSMAQSESTISKLADQLPRYAIHKTKVTIDRDQLSETLKKLQTHFSNATADNMDGLRLDWPKSWLLVRASNTEPIVRLIAEAETLEEAVRLCDEAAKEIVKQR